MQLQNDMPMLMSGYRALDLTDEKGFLCGQILGGLGVDVIKVEKPGGDRSRIIPPFYKNIVHPEKSLYWMHCNRNKRGITLDIEIREGRDIFIELVKTADFVFESFNPGYMEQLGLGYQSLKEINPRVIMTSISPYGQTGPYSGYKYDDLTLFAMSSTMMYSGEPDRAPVYTPNQMGFYGGVHGATGSMVAHYHRELSGEGQHVDVSIQQAGILTLMNGVETWDLYGIKPPRSGHLRTTTRGEDQLTVRMLYPCKDGWAFIHYGGAAGGVIKASNEIMKMAAEEGLAGDYADYDFHDHDGHTITQEERTALEEILIRFLKTKTKKELMELALEKELILGPLFNIGEIWESPHFRERGYWEEVDHPELGETLTFPGEPFKISAAPWRTTRRAPLIGEHNEEIFVSITPERETVNPEPVTVGLKNNREKRMGGKQVFEGLKVADFSWVGVGPQVARELAEHGATVIRVESHTSPDSLRLSPPFKDMEPGIDRSAFGTAYNTNKYGMSLNLNHPKSKDVARRLVAWADIVAESMTPGNMARWELDYENCRKIKSDIIYYSSTQAGQTGPWKNFGGYGQQGASIVGFYDLIGWPDRPPSPPVTAITDFIAPWFLATALIAALDYRRRTGKGTYIDHSQWESGMYFLGPWLMDYKINGRLLTRMGNRNPNVAPHGAFPCKGEDRWVAISVRTDEEWRAFCEVIGRPEWIGDDRFAVLEARKKNEDELENLIGKWTEDHEPEEVMHLMQKARVPAGVVGAGIGGDMFEDPQLKQRKHFRRLDHKVIGNHVYNAPSYHLSKTPNHIFKAGPCLGEDNEYVYKEILGYTNDDIAEFMVEGVITTEHDLPGASEE
ncbi:MAG: CoA transferase [Desulfobacteraceae bacterium]|nr:CoA transferase [Desulfobacteraceae bacterium]